MVNDTITVNILQNLPLSVNVITGSGAQYNFDFLKYAKDMIFENIEEVTSIYLPDMPNWTLDSYAKNNFKNATNLQALIIGNVPKATKIREIVRYCPSLKIFKIGNCPNVTESYAIALSNLSVDYVEIGHLPRTTTLQQAFSALGNTGNLKTLIIGDVPLCTNMNYLCQNQVKLENLTLGDFSGVTSITSSFVGCSSLENVNFTGKTCSVNISFSPCSKLTHDSVINIFNALPVVASTKTLTLHAQAKARVSAQEIEIATSKGWTVA